ncbi:MAG: PqqD family peptide modification chaperone [Desulfobulbaceae bacterium]|nr:PqqD family peptide modification chaperone [Desulfobulbaceae bacterium]
MTPANLLSLDNQKLNTLLVSRGKDHMATELEGEVVLLDLASNNFVGLDAVGSAIWQLLEQPISFHNLCQRLMAKYNVTEDVCRADVLSFLKELGESNLITVSEE